MNFGIFCSTPGVPLVRNVPRKVAAHMLFTGSPIHADEAYQAGLVSKVVPNDKLGKKKIQNLIYYSIKSEVFLYFFYFNFSRRSKKNNRPD